MNIFGFTFYVKNIYILLRNIVVRGKKVKSSLYHHILFTVFKCCRILIYYNIIIIIIREQSFLTKAEEIFEDLKKFLSPGSMWPKVLVPQHSLSKSFGTATTKFKIAQKVLQSYPFYNFTIVFISLTLNQKKSKEFNSFSYLCFKMILIFKNDTSPATMTAP